jgi:Protein of unknown function (DUF3153)
MMRWLRPNSKSVPKIILRQFIKLRLLWFILVSTLLLSGCVHYDTGIKISDANHGEIIQHIRLKAKDDRLSDPVATTWIESLVQRTQTLGGKTRHPEAREWVMTIPFYNARDLEAKFNQLFQSSQTTLPLSRLQIRTKNRVMWQRNELCYDLDLRSLRAILQGDFSESLDLEFKLRAPGGAQVPTESGKLSPKLRKKGWQLVWKLQPGMMNHIEAVFWVPSPIGTGFVLISLWVIGGYMVKVLSKSGIEIATAELEAD